MTKPIQLFVGDGDHNAWYINGELVTEDMSQNAFMFKFMDVHRDKSHIDPDTGFVVKTIEEAERIRKAARLAQYKDQLKRQQEQVARLQGFIDEMESE